MVKYAICIFKKKIQAYNLAKYDSYTKLTLTII